MVWVSDALTFESYQTPVQMIWMFLLSEGIENACTTLASCKLGGCCSICVFVSILQSHNKWSLASYKFLQETGPAGFKHHSCSAFRYFADICASAMLNSFWGVLVGSQLDSLRYILMCHSYLPYAYEWCIIWNKICSSHHNSHLFDLYITFHGRHLILQPLLPAGCPYVMLKCDRISPSCKHHSEFSWHEGTDNVFVV